ncbi:MAG TPA: hypothetical protein VM537_29680 [Anaerolineae bacterium]|nr:hypothetical protein [Anaerolineae bacterium]
MTSVEMLLLGVGSGGGGEEGDGMTLLGRPYSSDHRYLDLHRDPGVEWRNQDSASIDFALNGAYMVADSANELNVVWLPTALLPAGDWVVLVETRQVLRGGNNSQGGLVALVGGTIDTPGTNGLLLMSHYQGALGSGWSSSTWNSYTTFSSSIGNPYFSDNTPGSMQQAYSMIGYDSVAGECYGAILPDFSHGEVGSGVQYQALGSYDPTRVGFVVSSAAEGATAYLFRHFRVVVPGDPALWPMMELIGRV